jgi:phosphoglycerate dehydrogenase-like enzyme
MVNVGGFGDQLLGFMRAALPDEEVVALPLDGRPSGASGEILATLTVDRPTLERALTPEVRWVHVLGAGVDRFPLEAVGDRMLTCSRGASAVAIAEFVLAVMLAFEKHLPDSWIDAPPPQWNIASLGGLRGRTAGIIGLGAIGTEVARRALAFDMRVVAVRRTSTPTPIDGVRVIGSLTDLLGQSDHVVVAAPATPETHHLINATTLTAMKAGAHLVNVGRGSLVDQAALLSALDDGHLAMASLDVVDPEPLPAGHALFSHPKVRLSPHISWSSPDTARRTFALFVENVRRYRAGVPLHGVVDIRAGY